MSINQIGNSGMSALDADQVIRKSAVNLSNGSTGQQVMVIGGSLVTEEYNEIDLTYVASGPGTGEIQTVIYKKNGTTIATLTLTYDGSNRLSTVIRS